MRSVFYFVKQLEIIFCLICLGINIKGFMTIQKTWGHKIQGIICLAFSLMAMFSSINMCIGNTPEPLPEAIKATIAAIWFLVLSVVIMYTAEKDFTTLYLTAKDDLPMFPFFVYSKALSIASLMCGILYMMHATFAYDLHFYKPKDEAAPAPPVKGKPLKRFSEAKQTDVIELHLFGKACEMKLKDKFECYKAFVDNTKSYP